MQEKKSLLRKIFGEYLRYWASRRHRGTRASARPANKHATSSDIYARGTEVISNYIVGVGTNRWISASSSLIETGFSRQSMIPALRQTSSVGFERQSAVQATMGICSVWGRLRNSRATSKPVMSGKRRSNKTKFGLPATAVSIAALPVGASRTS